MLNFDREPQKSAQEREFDELCEKYAEKFGEGYGLFIGMDSPNWPELLADIRRCIETGEPQKKPEYKAGYDY